MVPGEIDSLWGINIPTRGDSVDNFWMDETKSPTHNISSLSTGYATQ